MNDSITRQDRSVASLPRGWCAASWVAGGLFALAAAAPLSAQVFGQDHDGDDGVLFEDRQLEREYASQRPLFEHDGRRYIVVHLAENRVFVFEGGRAVWSAPAGTGANRKGVTPLPAGAGAPAEALSASHRGPRITDGSTRIA